MGFASLGQKLPNATKARAYIKVISLGLAGLVLAVLGVPASAGQVTLNGTVDANLYDPTGTGDFTQIQTNPVGRVIEDFVGYLILPFEKRAVIEFSTSSLPSNASIQSVTFNFETTSTANNEHLVGVLAYAGSGTITLADATAAASQVGTYEDTAVGSTTQVSLTSSDFQSLFDQQSGYFALRLQGLEQTVNTSIAGIAGESVHSPHADDRLHALGSS